MIHSELGTEYCTSTRTIRRNYNTKLLQYSTRRERSTKYTVHTERDQSEYIIDEISRNGVAALPLHSRAVFWTPHMKCVRIGRVGLEEVSLRPAHAGGGMLESAARSQSSVALAPETRDPSHKLLVTPLSTFLSAFLSARRPPAARASRQPPRRHHSRARAGRHDAAGRNGGGSRTHSVRGAAAGRVRPIEPSAVFGGALAVRAWVKQGRGGGRRWDETHSSR